MKPEWRTNTVVLLCQSMREAQEYSVTPILADALQDAGCDDVDLLASLRSPLPFWSAERLVALVYSDEAAAAVRWIDQFAAELGEGGYPGNLPAMTYDRLMTGAYAFNSGDEFPFEDGSMNWSNNSDEREREFWSAFQKVTGARLNFEIEHRGTVFFACHC